MAKTKGVAFMTRLEILRETYGKETLDAILEAMEPQHREALKNILFSSWYDAAMYRDMNCAIKKVLGARYPNISEKIGELTAEQSLKGVYSSKLKENNVLMTLDRAASLWKMFHDEGELVVAERQEGKVVLQFKGYPLPHREFCENLVGWGRRMIELSGGQNARVVETKCVCKGGEFCEIVATWG